jgi:hypothetical protein
MSKEGQEIEGRIELARNAVATGFGPPRELLAEIDERLASVVIPATEWETLYRIRLQLERDALAGATHGLAGADGELPNGEGRAGGGRRLRLDVAAAASVAGLLALDIVVALSDRDQQERRPKRRASKGR